MVRSSFSKEQYGDLSWYRELLVVLIKRSLKRRYRGSILGIYWSLLNPIAMTGFYTAIFGAAFASYYDNSTLNYILAAFTGLVVVNFFSSSTVMALRSVVENGRIVNKIRLPLVIFPLAAIGGNVFQLFLGAFPLLLIGTILISHSWRNAIALFLPAIALILVCSGVGLFMSALFVFFRDLLYFYELLTFLLLMGSPIFYPADIVPEAVRKFLIFNPILPIIESIRQIVLSGDLPDISLIVHSFASGSIVFAIGVVAFSSWRSQFMDLL
ncbi:MAG: ABC transporter permease [Cyanobacteria bacterium J06623_7]